MVSPQEKYSPYSVSEFAPTLQVHHKVPDGNPKFTALYGDPAACVTVHVLDDDVFPFIVTVTDAVVDLAVVLGFSVTVIDPVEVLLSVNPVADVIE